MTRKLFVMFVAVSVIIVVLPLTAFAEADGFRGIKWGTKLSTLKNMQLLEENRKGQKVYSRKDDQLRIGGADLESIDYHFWQDKFCSVVVKCKGYLNFRFLKDSTFEKFGAGSQTNPFMEDYMWYGETTGIMLKYNEISQKGSLSMFSREILAILENYEKEEAKKGAKKDF